MWRELTISVVVVVVVVVVVKVFQLATVAQASPAVEDSTAPNTPKGDGAVPVASVGVAAMLIPLIALALY